jgi:hypothetical protein
MLSSVNCDDYFEWRRFGRATSGEEDIAVVEQQKEQKHKPPAEHGRRQRHGLWAAKKCNEKRQQEDMFTTLNKSFEYRSHGEIATLVSKELEVDWPSANKDSKVGDVCGILSIYSDPIDTESIAEYAFLPSQPECRLKSPQVSASPRRQPLLERSNLPLGPTPSSYPPGIQRSKKCRAVSLSPARSALKSPAGRADRENAGKPSNFPSEVNIVLFPGCGFAFRMNAKNLFPEASLFEALFS